MRIPHVRARSMLSLLVLCSSSAAALAQGKPDLYVLSVGIDRYAAPTNNLKGCVNDADGMAKVLKGQEGKQFGRTDAVVLTDAKATLTATVTAMKTLEGKGKAGDWYALVLSGHGGITRQQWTFLTQDNRNLSDEAILGFADRLAGGGKKVMIIIDACHAGQLRYAANTVLNRYAEGNKGGIVLMVSSMPSQTSAALGAYSAFARAVEEGLSGMADYDGDETVTLKELRRFSLNRVYELRLKNRIYPGLSAGYQDSAIDASLSMAETIPLVRAKRPPAAQEPDDGPDAAATELAKKTWKATIPGSDKAPPITFQLVLDPFGHYTATLIEGTRSVGLTTGAYKVKAKALQLIHHQGTDRLELVAATTTEFRFKFQSREFKLTTAPQGDMVLNVSGNLAEQDARDRVRKDSPHKSHTVKLETGTSYVINLQSPDFDTYLRIEDADGKNLAEDDDGGEGRNSRLRFSPTRSGEYRMIATTFRAGSGTYDLTVEKTSGPRPVAQAQAGQEVLNVSDQLAANDPKDRMRTESYAKVFKADLKAGVGYTIDLVSTDFDTYLRLEDSAGKHLMEDDDSGVGLNARLTLTPSADASYRIVATSYKPATGRFTLTVRANGQGRGAAAAGAPLALQAGTAKVEERLTNKDDLDAVRKTSYRKVYLVKMEAKREYTINLKSKDFDAYLRLEDDAGKQVASDDDGGGDRNALIRFTAPATGTYRIIATTFGERTMGAFLLSVEESPR
jgi:Caspase domain/Bacterial pre-peptidase C-terminal domain